jgi:hypothetical protein
MSSQLSHPTSPRAEVEPPAIIAKVFKKLFGIFAGTNKQSVSPPNPEPLLKAMNAVAREDSPGNRTNLYRQFLNSWLWFCVPEFPEGWKAGMTVAPAGMQISVATPNNAKGEKILPVFTDPEALANFDPNSPNMAFPAPEIFKMAIKIGVEEVVVNPFDPIRKPIRAGGNLTRREFEALAQGMVPQFTQDGTGQVLTIQKPTQVQIGGCKAPASEELKTKLCATAAKYPELEKIFRYRMMYVETETVSDVYGLVCSLEDEPFHAMTRDLMSSIQPFVPQNEYVDFTVVDASRMELMQKHGEVIYQRSEAIDHTRGR